VLNLVISHLGGHEYTLSHPGGISWYK